MNTGITMIQKQSNLSQDDSPMESRSGAKPSITLNAVDLFAGGTELKMVYKDQEYRLRITRNDKLILTK